MVMYLIMGRTGSGKTYFANLLQNIGLKRVVSRTTRKKRDHEDGDAYIWLNKNQAKKQKDRVAQTKIGDIEYFTLNKDLDGKDFYIIDPKGMYDLTKNTPDVDYHLIYVQAPSKEERQKHTINRENNIEQAKAEFEKRNADEDKQFSDFEKLMDETEDDFIKKLPKNVYKFFAIPNDYKNNELLKNYATMFANDLTLTRRTADVVKASVDAGMAQLAPSGKLLANRVNKNTKQKEHTELTPDEYAEMLLSDGNNFAHFMSQWLIRDNRIDKIFHMDL